MPVLRGVHFISISLSMFAEFFFACALTIGPSGLLYDPNMIQIDSLMHVVQEHY